MNLVQIQAADRALLSSVDAAMAEAARRSGAWLACRAGCTPCCHGPFAITRLDELRLQSGLREHPGAAAIVERARQAVERIAPEYPGDAATGELFDEDALPSELDEEPCPALDPASGHCELYESRPMTCRTFGPAARTADGSYGACELCYDGASDEEIAACAVEPDPDGREMALLAELGEQGRRGMTLVAFALARGLVVLAALWLGGCSRELDPAPRLVQNIDMRSLVAQADGVVAGRLVRLEAGPGREQPPVWTFFPLGLRIRLDTVLKGDLRPGQEIVVRTYDGIAAGSMPAPNRNREGERYLFFLRRSTDGWRSIRDVWRWSFLLYWSAPEPPLELNGSLEERIAQLLLTPSTKLERTPAEFESLAYLLTGPTVWVPLLRRAGEHPNPAVAREACGTLSTWFPFDQRCSAGDANAAQQRKRWRRSLAAGFDDFTPVTSPSDLEFIRAAMRDFKEP